jgi:hypothetical protein
MIQKVIIAFVVFIILLLSAYITGCQRGKKITETNIVTHTVMLHDTTIHTVVDSFPFYIVKKDSIVYTDTIFKNVDTAKILSSYFAKHYYTRTWSDSLLEATSKDVISENKFIDNKFTYKIIRPQEIINTTLDNSVHYARYLYFGASLPVYPPKINTVNINYIALNGLFCYPKGYFELQYQPYTKTFSIGSGIRLFKFK